MEKQTPLPAPAAPAASDQAQPPLLRAARLFLSDQRGAALVEAAFVFPILIMLMMGIASYGQYFMIAHTVQQAANEAARAAITGIDEADRKNLIKASIDSSIAATPSIDRKLVTSTVSRSDDYYTVTVSYDTAQNKSLQSTSILPMPTGAVRRQSTVKLVQL